MAKTIQEKIDDFRVRLKVCAQGFKDKEKGEYQDNYPYSRWFVITGAKKVGNVRQFILDQFDETGLRKDKDWFLFAAGDPNPDAIYSLLYGHNGKILVLDQYQELLKGAERYLFWKKLFDSAIDHYPIIRAPYSGNGHYYDADRLSSSEQYAAEEQGMLPDWFTFTGWVILLTTAESKNDFYVKENQIDDDYRISLMQHATQIDF